MKQKHYLDVERLKPAYVHGFEEGEQIVIQEKVDGANFSIAYDAEENTIQAFSRKKLLNEKNNLRGAYEWSQTLDVGLVKKVLGSSKVLFMEWLVKHTVPYPSECCGKAYCYDVYDKENGKYLEQKEVRKIAERLGLIYIPVFYEGPFKSWEHVKTFVGKTALGGKYGEGVVVKNQTKLNNQNPKMPFYVKLVCDDFCETKEHRQSKPINPEAIKEAERAENLAKTIVTRARVIKLLNKLIDDNIISEDWDEKSMSIIAKNIGRNTYMDCLKEEPEIVAEVGPNFGKLANKISMFIVKQELKNKSNGFSGKKGGDEK